MIKIYVRETSAQTDRERDTKNEVDQLQTTLRFLERQLLSAEDHHDTAYYKRALKKRNAVAATLEKLLETKP